MRQILQTPDEMRIVNPYRYGGGGGSPYAALLAAIAASSPTLEYNALREYLAGNYSDSDAVTSATEWVSGTYPATQGTAANQPTFIESANGGHPAFRFDGGDLLQASGFTYSQPNTILVVATLESSGTSIYYYDGSGSSNRHALSTLSGQLAIFAGSGVYTGIRPDTTPSLISLTVNGASSSLNLNGSITGPYDTGTLDLSGITIGARYNASSGLIGDIQIGPLVYDTPPTSGQIAAIEQALEDLGYVTLS